VIYVENTDVYITNSSFNKNSVTNTETGKGGVLYIQCDVQNTTVCITNLVDSNFTNNSAPLEGGVVKYNLFEIITSNVTFTNNSAAYGDDVASFPLQLSLVDELDEIKTDDNTTYIEDSGETVKGSYRVGIFDLTSIIDVQDQFYGFITITRNNLATTSISKNTVAQPLNGVLIFDDFIISATPGTTVELEVTYEDIDQDKLSILGLETNLSFVIFKITMESCKDGEIIVNDIT
jgi:hypothetical protein